MAKNFFVVPTDASHADFLAVGAGSLQFAISMNSGEFYMFASSTACLIRQGSNPTASAAAGSTFVPAGTIVYIDGGVGAKLAVIQSSAGGNATLTRLKAY